MKQIILRRTAAALPLVIIATMITFGLIFLIPGDPAVRVAGAGATEREIASVARDLGLDRPAWERYLGFVGGIFRGDLGTSYTYNAPVRDLILERLPATLSLTLLAMSIALLLGVPAGILAAARRGRWQDRATTTLATVGLATPNFVLGLWLIIIFSIQLRWLPATGYAPISDGVGEWLKHLILPSFSLALLLTAEIARQLRGSLIDAMGQDYVKTAIAKGLSPLVVICKHAFKNASMPLLTVVGLQLVYMLGGTAVVETVFGINGLGRVAVEAVVLRDLPAIQGIVVFAVFVTIVASLVVDLAYSWINPKVRRA